MGWWERRWAARVRGEGGLVLVEEAWAAALASVRCRRWGRERLRLEEEWEQRLAERCRELHRELHQEHRRELQVAQVADPAKA